jgi:hypothetical protein
VVGVASELEDDDGHQASKPPVQAYQAKPIQTQQPKPKASGQWWIDVGLSTEMQVIVATDILVNKGWLSQGQALADLSPDHQAELANPKMKLAFLEAVKSRLS